MARRLKFPSLYAVNDERLHGARLNITEYKPVSDASGRVIGALFVGVDIDAQIQALEDQIHALKVGESGYYFVMDASNGPSRGKFIVHPSATGQASDDQNGPFSQMLDAKQGRIDYTSKDATLSESNARDKTVSFLSVPEWHIARRRRRRNRPPRARDRRRGRRFGAHRRPGARSLSPSNGRHDAALGE